MFLLIKYKGLLAFLARLLSAEEGCGIQLKALKKKH